MYTIVLKCTMFSIYIRGIFYHCEYGDYMLHDFTLVSNFSFQKSFWKISPIYSTIIGVMRYFINVTSYYYNNIFKSDITTKYFFKLSIAII